MTRYSQRKQNYNLCPYLLRRLYSPFRIHIWISMIFTQSSLLSSTAAQHHQMSWAIRINACGLAIRADEKLREEMNSLNSPSGVRTLFSDDEGNAWTGCVHLSPSLRLCLQLRIKSLFANFLNSVSSLSVLDRRIQAYLVVLTLRSHSMCNY